MRNKTLVAATATFLFAAVFAHAKDIHDAYVYVGWPLYDTMILSRPTATDPKATFSNGRGDAISDLEYCSDESPFFCFESRTYTFAVPKRGLPEQKAWEFGGWRFEVIQDRRTVQLVGCSTSDVALIRATSKPDVTEAMSEDAFFYYSRTHGLLGFGLIAGLAKTRPPASDPDAGGWWLANTLGFGATITEADAWPDCRQPPSRKARQE